MIYIVISIINNEVRHMMLYRYREDAIADLSKETAEMHDKSAKKTIAQAT